MATFTDDFTGTNGSPPNPEYWITVPDTSGIVELQSNQLYSLTDTTDIGDNYAKTRFVIEGDFNLEVDFNQYDLVEALDWVQYIRVNDPVNGYFAYVGKGYMSGNRAYRFRYYDGGVNSNTDVTSGYGAENPGKLRLERIGSTLSGYYYNSGWVLIDSQTYHTDAVEVRLGIYKSNTSAADGYVYHDNLSITADNINYAELAYFVKSMERQQVEVSDGNPSTNPVPLTKGQNREYCVPFHSFECTSNQTIWARTFPYLAMHQTPVHGPIYYRGNLFGTQHVNADIIEFDPAYVKVQFNEDAWQHSKLDTATQKPQLIGQVTCDAVDMSRSFIISQHQGTSGEDDWDHHNTCVSFYNNTEVRFQRSFDETFGSNIKGFWFVVEALDWWIWDVHHTADIPLADDDYTVYYDVPQDAPWLRRPENTLIIASYRGGENEGSRADRSTLDFDFVGSGDSLQVRIRRTTATDPMWAKLQLVTSPYFNIQRGQMDFVYDDTEKTVEINPVRLDTSMVWGSQNGNPCNVDWNTNGNEAQSFTKLSLTDTNEVTGETLAPGDSAGEGKNAPFQVISFEGASSGLGTTTTTTTNPYYVVVPDDDLPPENVWKEYWGDGVYWGDGTNASYSVDVWDWESYTLDQQPSDWTRRDTYGESGPPPAPPFFHVKSKVTPLDPPYDNRVLKIRSGNAWNMGCSPNAVGSILDSEQLMLFTQNTTNSNGGGLLNARRQGSPQYRTHYWLDLYNTNKLKLTRVVGGAFYTLDEVAVPYSVDTWYWMRFYVFGTNPVVIRGKVWEYGTEEPETWDIEYNDSNALRIQTAGYVGPSDYSNAGFGPTPYTDTDVAYYRVEDGGDFYYVSGPGGYIEEVGTWNEGYRAASKIRLEGFHDQGTPWVVQLRDNDNDVIATVTFPVSGSWQTVEADITWGDAGSGGDINDIYMGAPSIGRIRNIEFLEPGVDWEKEGVNALEHWDGLDNGLDYGLRNANDEDGIYGIDSTDDDAVALFGLTDPDFTGVCTRLRARIRGKNVFDDGVTVEIYDGDVKLGNSDITSFGHSYGNRRGPWIDVYKSASQLDNLRVKLTAIGEEVHTWVSEIQIEMDIDEGSTTTTTTTTTTTGILFFDDFTGADDDPPDPDDWKFVSPSTSIQSNKLNTSVSGGVSAQGATTVFSVGGGNFNAIVDFDLVQHPSTNFWLISMEGDEVFSNVEMTIQRIYNTTGGASDGYRAVYDDGGGVVFGSKISRDDLSGKLRLERKGLDWTAYAWYNSQWNVIDTMTQLSAAGEINIRIEMRNGDFDPIAEGNFDNFTIYGLGPLNYPPPDPPTTTSTTTTTTTTLVGWVEYFDDTKWENNANFTWDGDSWSAFTSGKLSPIGTWYQGLRPTHFRLTYIDVTGTIYCKLSNTAEDVLISYSDAFSSGDILECDFSGGQDIGILSVWDFTGQTIDITPDTIEFFFGPLGPEELTTTTTTTLPGWNPDLDFVFETDVLVDIPADSLLEQRVGFDVEGEERPFGWKWDEMIWSLDQHRHSVVLPTLSDPDTATIPDDSWQSGIGHNLDLKIHEIVEDPGLGHPWHPLVRPGHYFIGPESFYLFTPNNVTRFGGNETLSGLSKVDLHYMPKQGTPLLVAFMHRDADGGVRNIDEFRKKVRFTGETTTTVDINGNLVSRVEEVELDADGNVVNYNISNLSVGAEPRGLEYVVITRPEMFVSEYLPISVGKGEAKLISIDLEYIPVDGPAFSFSNGDIFQIYVEDQIPVNEGEYSIGYAGSTTISEGTVQVVTSDRDQIPGYVTYWRDFPATVLFNDYYVDRIGFSPWGDPDPGFEETVPDIDLVTTSDYLGMSSAKPNQIFYLSYFPLVDFDSLEVYVYDTRNDVVARWERVDDIEAAGPDDEVFTVSPDGGFILFGDGIAGKIPHLHASIGACYNYVPYIQYMPDEEWRLITPEEVNLQPLFNSTHRGFVYLSHKELTVDSLLLQTDRSRVADRPDTYGPIDAGNDYALLTCTAFDKDGGSVPDVDISWKLNPSMGFINGASPLYTRVQTTTDSSGKTRVVYTPVRTAGDMGTVVNLFDGLGNPIDNISTTTIANDTLQLEEQVEADVTDIWLFMVLDDDPLQPYDPYQREGGRKVILYRYDETEADYVPVRPTSIINKDELLFDYSLPTPTEVPALVQYTAIMDRVITVTASTVNPQTGLVVESNPIKFYLNIPESQKGVYTLPTSDDKTGSTLDSAVYLTIDRFGAVQFIFDVVTATTTTTTTTTTTAPSSPYALSDADDSQSGMATFGSGTGHWDRLNSGINGGTPDDTNGIYGLNGGAYSRLQFESPSFVGTSTNIIVRVRAKDFSSGPTNFRIRLYTDGTTEDDNDTFVCSGSYQDFVLTPSTPVTKTAAQLTNMEVRIEPLDGSFDTQFSEVEIEILL